MADRPLFENILSGHGTGHGCDDHRDGIGNGVSCSRRRHLLSANRLDGSDFLGVGNRCGVDNRTFFRTENSKGLPGRGSPCSLLYSASDRDVAHESVYPLANALVLQLRM